MIVTEPTLGVKSGPDDVSEGLTKRSVTRTGEVSIRSH